MSKAIVITWIIAGMAAMGADKKYEAFFILIFAAWITVWGDWYKNKLGDKP